MSVVLKPLCITLKRVKIMIDFVYAPRVQILCNTKKSVIRPKSAMELYKVQRSKDVFVYGLQCKTRRSNFYQSMNPEKLDIL